jgi:hypothetical protein
MSRTTLNTRGTPRPGAVTVICDNCVGGFVTDEMTAYGADQNDEDLLCKPCENGQSAMISIPQFIGCMYESRQKYYP